MKTIRRTVKMVLVAVLAVGSVATAGAQTAAGPSDPAALALLRGFEDKLNLEGLDLSNVFTLVQKKPGESDRVLRIKIYRRDAENTFALIFQYPESEKGKGYYRSGDDLFLYLPSTREFVFRNRKDDVGSTDVRTDLFGKLELENQYKVSAAGSATVAKWDCDVLVLEARKLDVAFPQQKWYIRRADGLPVKVENFSASGTLLRTLYYIDYQKLPASAQGGSGEKRQAGPKYLFTKLLSVDALQKGQQTYLTNESISTATIPDYTFSKAFLEEQSR